MKTYKTEMNDIKKSFGMISETKIARDCGMLIERIITGNIFPNFHIYLKTPEERKTFLEIEKKWGADYNPDTLKVKPGKAIGWYRDLVSVFPDHVRISPKILTDLNTVKGNRNDAVHNRPVSESQAHHSLLSTINIITALNMLDESDDLTGIPIHIYLVFSSIEEKYRDAKTDADISKIISDSNILLPQLMNVTIDKLYGIRPPERTWKSFDIKQKEDLVEIFIKNGHCELDLEACFEVFNELGLFSLFYDGMKLQTAFEHISSTEINDKRTKFDAIPYINAMEILIEQLSRDLDHANNFFKLADSIKRNYLNDMQISEQEDFALRENARTLGIDQETYSVFKPNVVKEIEEHLIKYKTLESESSHNDDPEVEKNLINMIKLGIPFEAVKLYASQLDYSGNIETLFSKHSPSDSQRTVDAPKTDKLQDRPISVQPSSSSDSTLEENPLQTQLMNEFIKLYPNAVVKKIHKDPMLDIHMPDIHPKRGTHIYINTIDTSRAKGIRVGFYCRDKEWCSDQVERNPENMEVYGMGVRIIGNPLFNSVDEAIDSAKIFIGLLLDNGDDKPAPQPVSTMTSSQNTPASQGKKVPAYEKIRKAMESFGEGYIASYGDIMDYCNREYGETKKSTFRTYIISCTVNHDTRVHYHPNKKPRTEIADSDVLYQIEKGKVVLYEPEKHGKWIIRYNEDHKLIIEKE